MRGLIWLITLSYNLFVGETQKPPESHHKCFLAGTFWRNSKNAFVNIPALLLSWQKIKLSV